jgi:hypothetical protein
MKHMARNGVAFFMVLLAGTLFAGRDYLEPQWWFYRGVFDGNGVTRVSKDYAPVNQGQVKQMAYQAYLEFEQKLGGASADVINLVAGFSNTNNYFPVNLGQLKTIAKPFYDQLWINSYTNTWPEKMTTGPYPWSGSTNAPQDYAIANMGQLKHLFSFDLDLVDTDGDGLFYKDEINNGTDPFCADSDTDGIPDGWEVSRGLNPLVNDAGADPDDDGLAHVGEFMAGAHPFTRDTDEDGIPDGWEVGHGSSPRNKSDGLSDPDGDGLNNLEAYQTRPVPSVDDTDGDGFINAYDVRVNEFDCPVVGTALCNLVASSWYSSPVLVSGCGFGSSSEQLLTLYWSANFYYPPRPPSFSGGYLEDGLCVSPGSSQLRWQGIKIPGSNGGGIFDYGDEYYEDYWFMLDGPLRPFWQPQLPDGLPYNIDSESLYGRPPSELESEIAAYAYSQPSLCYPTNGNGWLHIGRSWEEYTYGEEGGVIATQTYYYCIAFSREKSEPQPPLTSLQCTDTMVPTGGALQSYGHPYDPYDHGQSVFKFVFNQPVTNRVVKWLTYSEIHQDTIFGNHAVHQCEVTGTESGLFKSTDQFMIFPTVDLNGDFDSDGDVDIDDTILRAPASASLPIVPTGQINEIPGSGVVLVTVDANFFTSGMPASTLKFKFSGVDPGEHFRLWSTTNSVSQEPASMMAGMAMAGGGGALRSTTNTVPQEPAPGIVPMMASGGRERQLIVDIPLLIDTEAGLEHDWPVEEHYDYSPAFPKTLYLECVSCGVTNDGRAKIELVYEYNGEEICATALPITVIRSKLVPDWNHDRSIDMADQNQDTNNAPFRFWINDDNDSGDISEGDSDVPGQGGWFSSANYEDDLVNGRSDLSDFFPVWLDIGAALSNYPPGNGNEYRLGQADDALKFVYTDLTNTNAGDYLITSNRTCGVAMNQNSYEADTLHITSSGISLDTNFLNRIAANTNKGVLMMEAVAPSTAPLTLEIWQNDSKVWETRLALSLSGVEDMYRWINLRHVTGGGEDKLTNADKQPGNNPDSSYDNGKHVVFIHGYNVSEESARGTSAEVFKRLYQSGSKARFTGVTWEGDVHVIFQSAAKAYYHADVINAFNVASNFATEVSQLGGEKYVIAHSLGNMVISSAIKDYGLNPARYFMIDAAVAMEAYRASSTDIPAMIPLAWRDYTNNLRSSDWHTLFDESDGRRQLTWRGRFGDIPQAVNYYSSGEDILKNNEEAYPDGPQLPDFSGEHAWFYQEMIKGRWQMTWLPIVECHGGWGFNSVYKNPDGSSPLLPEYANQLAPDQLRTNSFFRVFCRSDLYDPVGGSNVAKNRQVQSKLLAEAIPATSWATGGNMIDGRFSENNTDLMSLKNNQQWTAERDTDKWRHGDFKDVSYFFNFKLYDEMCSPSRGGLQ